MLSLLFRLYTFCLGFVYPACVPPPRPPADSVRYDFPLRATAHFSLGSSRPPAKETLTRVFPPPGLAVSSYASFKAIESDAKDDDTQWLTYWVVYAFLMIAESFADYSVFWIPGYRFAKCGLIFWLANPRFKGACMLYERVLRDSLKAAEPVVDAIAGSLARGDIKTAKAELSKHVDVDKLQSSAPTLSRRP